MGRIREVDVEHAGDADETSGSRSLVRERGSHRPEGVLNDVFWPAACVATLAAQRREIGLRWTLFGIALQLVVAYALAVVVFQVGVLLW